MKPLTYHELLNRLQQLTPEQLNQSVTVHHGSTDEFYAVHATDVTYMDDVLDTNHFYLEIE